MAQAKKTTKKAAKEAELIVETSALDSTSQPENIEAPVTAEADISDAAMDAAEQEQAVIQEKRAEDTTTTAKAGKRSHKALEEGAAKQAKEERKASGEETEAKPAVAVKPTRSRLERRAKGFRKAAEQIEKGKMYTL